MAKAVGERKAAPGPAGDEAIDLQKFMSRRVDWKGFNIWIVGDTPLIVHAWSEKAKREILEKQVKATRGGREMRKPEQDFLNAFYKINDTEYGFPAMAIKNCIVSAAHKDKGIPQTVVQRALFLYAAFYEVRPALSAAVCNMPLLKVYGSDPIMREDMGRIGTGLKKTAALIYRPSFEQWALNVKGKFNAAVMNYDILNFLIEESGYSAGIGEWRNERKGMFGAFHQADSDEVDAWQAFADGKGPLPTPIQYREAAQ
jgi:hypothetical protein